MHQESVSSFAAAASKTSGCALLAMTRKIDSYERKFMSVVVGRLREGLDPPLRTGRAGDS